MKAFYAAIWAESHKIWRSKILWIMFLAFSFISVMVGFMVFISMNPDLVSSSSVISAKASFIASADWPSYYTLLYQLIAAIGLMGFSFLTSWVFGREYSDRTIKDLLALPVSRYIIVLSKFIIIILWCILLSIVVFLIGLITGIIVKIPGWSGETAMQAFFVFAITSLLTILLSLPTAFFASWGRGYLLPIGVIILIMMITQFFVAGLPALSPFFPWAVPALFCCADGSEIPYPETISYIMVIITSLVGIFGTIVWWRFADHK
jgi:ABC-2 type transport system permease protein